MGKKTPKSPQRATAKSPGPEPVAASSSSSVSKKSKSKKKKPSSPYAESPLHDLLHTFERAPDQWAARYILILTAIILRGVVGLGSFLGQSQAPINGDFEAQRHWMELTIHLPIDQWYFYDLPYWGLDYPPLTAFHLFICGKIGSFINPTWFALDTSRGLESSGLKTFMRHTSLISELFVYFPALLGFIAFVGKKLNLSRIDQIVISGIIMCQPSLILIDHGHFQFNSVMLGLFLFSFTDLCKGNYLLASVWFVCCITFKQMGLYYAPFIFSFLLSVCFTNINEIKGTGKGSVIPVLKSLSFRRLFSIGITVILTFITILAPFIYFASTRDVQSTLLQILIRVFPFQRGIFEDKVASFWCTTNLIIKYRTLFTQDQLAKLSLLATLISILPPCTMIFYKNIFSKTFLNQKSLANKYLALIYGFAATSWGFYLFSFQVHEKTVLVPLLPSTLLYLTADAEAASICQWINNFAVYSMWPLLQRDGLTLQYIITLALSNFLVGKKAILPKSIIWKIIIVLSYIAAFSIHGIEVFVPPLSKYPDLWVILNTTVSFGCFGIFWLWLLYKMYQL